MKIGKRIKKSKKVRLRRTFLYSQKPVVNLNATIGVAQKYRNT